MLTIKEKLEALRDTLLLKIAQLDKAPQKEGAQWIYRKEVEILDFILLQKKEAAYEFVIDRVTDCLDAFLDDINGIAEGENEVDAAFATDDDKEDDIDAEDSEEDHLP